MIWEDFKEDNRREKYHAIGIVINELEEKKIPDKIRKSLW